MCLLASCATYIVKAENKCTNQPRSSLHTTVGPNEKDDTKKLGGLSRYMAPLCGDTPFVFQLSASTFSAVFTKATGA